MAEGNAEIVRRVIDLWNRRDIEGALQWTDENFEMDWSNSIGPLKGVYQGHGEVIGMWKAFLDAWDELSWDVQELIELEDDRVIVVNNVHMRGKGSGVDVDATGVQMWTFGDGKLTRVKLFQTKEEALEAAGEA
jgi:ketosteroid isomerase-like protein